jgi:hypothetical protein
MCRGCWSASGAIHTDTLHVADVEGSVFLLEKHRLLVAARGPQPWARTLHVTGRI